MRRRFERRAIWQSVLLTAGLLLAGTCAVGCAGGSWLESPSEADLPLEATTPYPGAVDAAAHHPYLPASPVAKPLAGASASLSDEPQIEVPSVPALKREAMEQPTSTAPALAVVPIHLRKAPQVQAAAATPAAVPITAEAPPAAAESPLQSAAAPVIALAAANTASVAQPTPLLAAEPTLPAASTPAEATPIETKPLESTAEPVKTAEVDRQQIIQQAQSELIVALEDEIRERRAQNAADEELPRIEQQLRLLYLSAGRLDDAAAAVESLDSPQREAFKHMMFGLGVWLSPDEARRAPLRTAKVLRSLRDTSGELAAASKLELRKLAFCERVDYFGWYTEFPRNEFRPKEQVILYVEVENFAAEKKGPQGYETELQGSYQVFNERGEIVAERQLPLDRETCRNYRRDYFLAYPVYMPENIPPGRYRLELTIEDMKAKNTYQGRKLGEGLIEFSIRQ